MTKKSKKRVICSISGGIDSAVAMALLKERGFDVLAVFMRLLPEPYFEKNEERARKIAEILNVPFYVFDFRKEFQKKVVNYFLKSYKAGLTPNPCVVCNKEIKFELLFKKLQTLKADFIATGHYARVKKRGKTYFLLKGKDKNKDQSYFLWQLTQKILKRTLFPIGNYTKAKVKKLANKFNFPFFDVSESQEVCFIQTEVSEFLKRHLKTNPGRIVDTEGRTIGKHEGLWFYTIGQRKGIGLSGGPFYVLEKDVRQNLLMVTKNEKDLYSKELIAKSINWISGKKPKLPLKVMAKIRYKHQPASARVFEEKGNKLKVVFSKPQRAITPGQSVVFYQGERLLGGGIISK